MQNITGGTKKEVYKRNVISHKIMTKLIRIQLLKLKSSLETEVVYLFGYEF